MPRQDVGHKLSFVHLQKHGQINAKNYVHKIDVLALRHWLQHASHSWTDLTVKNNAENYLENNC